MSDFSRRIAPAVERELTLAAVAGNPKVAFGRLERAHVLGQASTRHHVRAHWHMLNWAWAQRDIGEFFGQVVRLIGAATKTAFGLVPIGNTGGSNVSPFERMKVPDELAEELERARGRR